MNDIAIRGPASGGSVLLPSNLREAMDLANIMAKGRLVPAPLQDKPSDCLLVIEVAMRWRMSPFAVAQEVSAPSGRLMFSGKIVAAAVQTSPLVVGRLDYEYTGEGDDRTVTVTGEVRGVGPKTVTVRLGDVKTSNQQWIKQPDQQLSYTGSRVWARRWVPEIMLGVAAPEELSEAEDVAPREVPNTAEDWSPPREAPMRAAPGSMREVAAEVVGRDVEAADPEPGDDALPLIYADGRLVPIAKGSNSGAPAIVVWSRAVLRQLALLESRAAVIAWRRDNGPLFASISEQHPEAVAAAERAIAERMDSLDA